MDELVTVPRQALADLLEWAKEERDVLHMSHLDPKTNLVEPHSVAQEIAEVDQLLATLSTSLS